jgi:hypothetical protein
VSAVASPPVALRRRWQEHGIAEICRARHVVGTLGGRFSVELDIDVDRDAQEIERWALAATLFGNRISTPVALRTYRALEQAGVRTIADAGGCDRESLVALLDAGGYARYDERTAARLLTLARTVADRYGGRLATVGEQLVEAGQLRPALLALPGWGPVTVHAFLRELRGVWPGAGVLPLDERTRAAAQHLRLPEELDPLSSLAAAAHLDLRDLEAGLVRLDLCHDLARCPGGEECPLAASGLHRAVQV